MPSPPNSTTALSETQTEPHSEGPSSTLCSLLHHPLWDLEVQIKVALCWGWSGLWQGSKPLASPYLGSTPPEILTGSSKGETLNVPILSCTPSPEEPCPQGWCQ